MSRYQDLKDIPFCEKHLPCEACTYRENKLREWYEAQLAKVKQERDECKPLVAAVKKYNVDTPQQLDALMKKRRERAEQAEADLSEALEALEGILALLPSREVIDALSADAGYGYRPYQLTKALKDSEIIKLQELAARLREGKG